MESGEVTDNLKALLKEKRTGYKNFLEVITNNVLPLYKGYFFTPTLLLLSNLPTPTKKTKQNSLIDRQSECPNGIISHYKPGIRPCPKLRSPTKGEDKERECAPEPWAKRYSDELPSPYSLPGTPLENWNRETQRESRTVRLFTHPVLSLIWNPSESTLPLAQRLW